MNKEEYENMKKQSQQENTNTQTTGNDNKISLEDTKRMVQQTEQLLESNNVDETIKNESTKLKDKDPSQLTDVPELATFMKTEEFLRLGTKARIPVVLKLNEHPFKIYIRALGSDEYSHIVTEARNKEENTDLLAACKVCTDSEGNSYPRSVLEQLGFANIRKIGEAINIASGESEDMTQEAITKQVIDNFMNS